MHTILWHIAAITACTTNYKKVGRPGVEDLKAKNLVSR